MPFEFVRLTPSSCPYGIKRTSLVHQVISDFDTAESRLGEEVFVM
jgi:hypothetical protein